MQDDRVLNRSEAAEYLTERGFKVSKTTLQKLVTVGGGPVYRRFGHRAVYRKSDLDIWVQERLSDPARTAPNSPRGAA